MKQSWKDKATNLDRRPVPGLLAAFQHVQLPGKLEDMVINALHTILVYFLQPCIDLLTENREMM